MSRKPDAYAVSDYGHISRMPVSEYARKTFPPEQFRYYYRITAEDRAVLLAAADDFEWRGCGQCDCSFACHEGRTRCIRLPVPDEAGEAAVRDGVLGEVLAEVERAIRKFPTWPTDPLHALAVLGEEYGELVKEALQLTYEPHKTSAAEVRKEAIQTAAMALRWVNSIDRYEYARGEQHEQDALAGYRDAITHANEGGK